MEKKIAVLGGGTGISTILRGLKNYTEDISAVVSMSDDGGGSGILRKELNILPPGDARRCLIALSNTDETLKELLNYRFNSGTLKNQNVGNILIAALTDIFGSFDRALIEMSSVFNVTGKIIPVTLDETHLVAEFASKDKVVGESYIPKMCYRLNTRIEKMSMIPHYPRANDDALKAILDGINSVLSASSVTGFTIPSEFLPEKLQDNFSKNGYQMIMANSKYQTASPEVKKQVSEMKSLINKYDDEGYLTGEAVLTDDLTVISDRDFQIVNLISIAVVFLIIALVFKSIGIPIVLIGAIELAIQINMGIPFYLNHTIPFITSIIIGVIQLGSTIDYSILMTDRFLAEYNKTKDVDESIKISVKETSKSIVTSALSFMAATIGVGIFSKMEIVSTICTFLARGAIISMCVIILLLPAIISVCFPLIKKTTKGLD